MGFANLRKWTCGEGWRTNSMTYDHRGNAYPRAPLFLKDVRLHQESGSAQLCDGTTHDDGIPLGGAS